MNRSEAWEIMAITAGGVLRNSRLLGAMPHSAERIREAAATVRAGTKIGGMRVCEAKAVLGDVGEALAADLGLMPIGEARRGLTAALSALRTDISRSRKTSADWSGRMEKATDEGKAEVARRIGLVAGLDGIVPEANLLLLMAGQVQRGEMTLPDVLAKLEVAQAGV